MNNNIMDFIKKNYKIIAILLVGIVLLVFPATDNETVGTNNIEKNLKSTLEKVEGVGEVDVMITFNNDNFPEGAIIVAQGADNVSIKKLLHDSAVAVLNVPDYKVQVLTKKNKGD